MATQHASWLRRVPKAQLLFAIGLFLISKYRFLFINLRLNDDSKGRITPFVERNMCFLFTDDSAFYLLHFVDKLAYADRQAARIVHDAIGQLYRAVGDITPAGWVEQIRKLSRKLVVGRYLFNQGVIGQTTTTDCQVVGRGQNTFVLVDHGRNGIPARRIAVQFNVVGTLKEPLTRYGHVARCLHNGHLVTVFVIYGKHITAFLIGDLNWVSVFVKHRKIEQTAAIHGDRLFRIAPLVEVIGIKILVQIDLLGQTKPADLVDRPLNLINRTVDLTRVEEITLTTQNSLFSP
jgi:hypothetical protein